MPGFVNHGAIGSRRPHRFESSTNLLLTVSYRVTGSGRDDGLLLVHPTEPFLAGGPPLTTEFLS
jgi:hypothetical protein